MHLPTPSPLFQIRLENDTLIMRGSQEESVGCVLRGQLVLAITEQSKFKEINLVFQGKSKVGWLDGVAGKGQYYRNEERIFYQYNWSFLPPKKQKQYHILKPNNYLWDFELVLPGTLPESVKGCQHGSIEYTLKAVAERPTFALRNLSTKRNLILTRCLLPTSLEYSQTEIIANTWTDRVEYEFSVDSKVFSFGEKIPVSIILRPLNDNLKIKDMICIFKEYVTYTIGDNKKVDSKALKIVKTDFSNQVDYWNHNIDISIPDNCNYDTKNDKIAICHKLKFFVTLVNQVDHGLCELRANIPIIISSSPMNLPAYDESYLSKSIDDSYSPSFNDDDELLYETDMSKLPSYNSISSFIPIPLADSSLPPPYDLVISGH